MKRLVNAYGVERALQIIGGHSTALEHPRERLALWTILKSRWPLLRGLPRGRAGGSGANQERRGAR